MASDHPQGTLPQVTKVLVLAVVVGTILLMLFKLVFPEVEIADVMNIIGFISLIIAVGLNLAWTRFRRRAGRSTPRPCPRSRRRRTIRRARRARSNARPPR